MIKRPIVIITICYIISILWGIYLKKYISLFCILLFIINIILYCEKNKNCKIKISKGIFIFLNICILIIFISTIIIQNKDNSFYNLIVQDNKIAGTAVITDVMKESEYNNNYIVKLNYSKNNNIKNYDSSDNKIRLYIKIPKNKYKKLLNKGDLIYLNGNFEKGEVSRNYKGFSNFNYLKQMNVYGIVKVENIKFIKNNSLNFYSMFINSVREKVKINLKNKLSKNNYEISLALLLGENKYISDDQKTMFSNASLSHILAISGMHVSYVIIGFGFLLKKVSKRLGKIIFIFLLINFAFFTGASPSVVRAVIMSVLTILANLIYKKSDSINNFAIACLIILLYNPYNLFNLGFQLSFLGTLGIILFSSKVENCLIKLCHSKYISKLLFKKIYILKFLFSKKYIIKIKCKKIYLSKIYEKIISILAVSISANILIFPIIMYNFNILSFTFLISNIVVTPILGLLIFSGYITVLLSFFSINNLFNNSKNFPINLLNFVAKIFDFIIYIFSKIAEFVGYFKFINITIPTPNIVTIIIIYIIIFLIFFYSKDYLNKFSKIKRFLKIIIIIILIILIISKLIFLKNNKIKIYFVDVGQGDCTLIVTSYNKKILIDGGGSENSNYDVGEKVVVPYLLDRKIKKLDYIIISHFDSDHIRRNFCGNAEFKG